MDSRDTKSSASPSLSDAPLNPSQPSYPYLRPATLSSLPSNPTTIPRSVTSNPVTPSTTLLPNAPHLTSQPQPLHSPPLPQTHPMFSSHRKPHARESNMHRPSTAIPTTHTNQSPNDSHQSHPQPLHALPSSSQPRSNLDLFSRPLSHSVMDTQDPMRITHLPRAPPLSSPPSQRFDLPNNHQELAQEQQLRAKQPPPYNSSTSQNQLPHLQTRTTASSPLPSEPLPQIALPQASHQTPPSMDPPVLRTVKPSMQNLPPQPASNDPSPSLNRSSAQQSRSTLGSPNQTSRQHSRPRAQFGQVQQSVDRHRSLQARQPPPLPPRPAMLAPPRGSLVMQDVPRYQRQVVPSVSSHPRHMTQMHDVGPSGGNCQTAAVGIQSDGMKQHGSSLDHQARSMYHHSMLSNPRQMAPVPAMAQQMPGSPAVAMGSAQHSSEQHVPIAHGLEHRPEPGSMEDRGNSSAFPRELGKHDRSFSRAPIADLRAPVQRSSGHARAGLHDVNRIRPQGDGDMYINSSVRGSVESGASARCEGDNGPRVFVADSVAKTKAMRDDDSQNLSKAHRTPEELISRSQDPSVPAPQRISRHHRGNARSVDGRSSIQEQPGAEHRTQDFHPAGEGANHGLGSRTIEGFVKSPQVARAGASRNLLELQSKAPDEEHLKKENSPKTNPKNVSKAIQPPHTVSPTGNRFSRSSHERNVESNLPHSLHQAMNTSQGVDQHRFQTDDKEWQQSRAETDKPSNSFATNMVSGAKDPNRGAWRNDEDLDPAVLDSKAKHKGQDHPFEPVSSRMRTTDSATPAHLDVMAVSRGSRPMNSSSRIPTEIHQPANFISNQMDVEKATHHDVEGDGPEKGANHIPESRDALHFQSTGVSLADSKKKAGNKDGTMSQRQETNRSATADENGSTQRKQLKVEDALAYLEKVKSQFSDQLSVYNQFLDIMKEFKADCIDTNEVIRRVSSLFRGHKDLVLGFNTFLPPGYKIRVTENTKTGILNTGFHGPAGVFNPLPPHRKIPAKVPGARLGSKKRGNSVSSPKEKETKHVVGAPDGQVGPSSSSVGTEQPEKDGSGAPISTTAGRAATAGGVKTTAMRRPHGFDSGNLQNSRAVHQPVSKVGGTEARAHEFERAIGFVTAIKERFVDAPDTFNEFLDALRRFREEQKSIREVFEAVADLFGPHKDLLSQFKEFIPTIAFSGIQESKALRDRVAPHGPRRNQGPRVISESTPSRKHGSFSGGALNGKMKPRHRVREMQFFEDLKAQLGPSKGHLYTEFIKCLSLFSQGIVSREELLHLTGEILRDDQDAHSSFLEYLDVMANMDEGVFEGEHQFSSSVSSEGEPTAVDAARIAYYTSKPMSEIAAEAGIEQMHSYRRMPHDFPPCEYSGRSAQEKRTLNDAWINVTSGSEDYSFKFMRRNQNEDNLFRCEDDRYELDLVIETNAWTIMKLETIVATISKLPLSEKKRHALAPGALTPIHFNAIRRIYGDSGPEVISQLKVNPSMAVPVILKRLKEKDITWREARMDMNKVWREVGERNFHRSLDHRSSHFKAVDKKDLSTKSLLLDIMDPVASVTAREAEMTRARGYPVENGGGGANHRSQALKAVLAAANYASDKSSRRLELKFEDFQVHRVVYKLLRDVVDDEVSKKSVEQFGEIVQSFFGVSFEENGTSKITTLASSEVTLLYGDDAVYIVMRIYHLLFERVALAFDLAREQVADRERRAKLTEEGNRRLARKGNRANIETKPWQLTKTMNNQDTDGKFCLGPTTESLEEICDQFLELTKQFVRAKLDWSRFEEKCRTLLGVDSYALFTIDKTVQKLIKGIETMFGGDSASARGFCELFYGCHKRLTEARVNGGRLDTEGIEVLYSKAASRRLAEVRGPGANLMRFQSSCEDSGRSTVLIHVIGQISDDERTRFINAEKEVLDKFLEFCGYSDDCYAHGVTGGSKEIGVSGKLNVASMSGNPNFSHAVKSKRGTGSRKQGVQKGGGCDFMRYKTDDRKVSEMMGSNSLMMKNGLEWKLDGKGVIRYATGTCDFLLNTGRKRAWDEGLSAYEMNEKCGRRKRMRKMLRLDEKGENTRTEDKATLEPTCEPMEVAESDPSHAEKDEEPQTERHAQTEQQAQSEQQRQHESKTTTVQPQSDDGTREDSSRDGQAREA